MNFYSVESFINNTHATIFRNTEAIICFTLSYARVWHTLHLERIAKKVLLLLFIIIKHEYNEWHIVKN